MIRKILTVMMFLSVCFSIQAFAALTPELCEQYKNYVLETSYNNGELKYKLFYLDDDDIPEMVIENLGCCIKIVSSDGNEAFYIASSQYDDEPELYYGAHGRFYECYERSGRIDTGAVDSKTWEFCTEYLFYDKASRTFYETYSAEMLSGETVDLCDYNALSAVEMCRDLDLIAQGKQPIGNGY